MIEKRFLLGIVIRDSKGSRVESADHRPMMVYEKKERPALQEDVLAYKDYGSTVVFVTCDGKKHTVSKTVLPKVEGVK